MSAIDTKKISLTTLLFLSSLSFITGCGSSDASIDLKCSMIGEKISYQNKMAYFVGFKKNEVDEVTQKIGRWLIYEEQSYLATNTESKIVPINDRNFEIVGCYKVVNSGYLVSFAGSGYNGYIVEDSKQQQSTILADSDFTLIN